MRVSACQVTDWAWVALPCKIPITTRSTPVYREKPPLSFFFLLNDFFLQPRVGRQLRPAREAAIPVMNVWWKFIAMKVLRHAWSRRWNFYHCAHRRQRGPPDVMSHGVAAASDVVAGAVAVAGREKRVDLESDAGGVPVSRLHVRRLGWGRGGGAR